MNRSALTLKTIQSTFVGLIILVVLLTLGMFTLETIINTLYPPLPICPPGSVDYPCYTPGPMFDLGQNFDKYIVGLIALYFVSICTAGFVSGLYVDISRLRTKAEDNASYVWQSLISGSIIGISAPLFLLAIGPSRSTSFSNILTGFVSGLPLAFILGLPATVSGFIGYKFNVYIRDSISKPKDLVTNLVIPSSIGLVIFIVLRALFNPIIGVTCEYFPVQGILLDACTESWIAFGIILSVSTFIAGWWTVRADKRFEYGIISGLAVGILGPLLEAYFYNQDTPLLAYFFYGVWGGLWGLCGSGCKRRFNYSWQLDTSMVRIVGVTGLGLVGIWAIVIGLKPCGRLDTFLNLSGCVRVLSGHEADIGWITVTPDGTLVAAGATDKTVKVWHNGTLLHTLNIGNDIYPLNFSMDGTVLAVASRNDGIIQLWNTNTGELQHRLDNGGWISNIAFSPDGKILAAATGPTKLWQVNDGTLLINLGDSQEGFDSTAQSVAFSADGKMLATGGRGVISLWQVEGCANTSQKCNDLIGLIDTPGDDVINSIAFSPQGNRLAAGSEDLTWVWQIDDCLSAQKCGQLLHTFKSKPFGVYYVAFSPDGEILAENSGNRQIRVWRLSDGVLLHDYNELPRGTHNLFFTSDNSILTTTPAGNTVQVWKLVSE